MEQALQRRGSPGTDYSSLTCSTTFERMQQLVADGKDVVGVSLNDAAGFGEFQSTTDSLKQLKAEISERSMRRKPGV